MYAALVFSGRIGSGKTSLSEETARRLSLPRAAFGDYVRLLAGRLGLDASERSVLQNLGELMARYPAPFVDGLLDERGYVAGTPIVIDGLRHAEVLGAIRARLAPVPVLLVHIEADPALAAERAGRRDGAVSAEMAAHSTERDADDALPQAANIVLVNDGTRQVGALVDDLLARLRVGGWSA